VLIPWLGGLRLADLDGPRLRATFAEIAETINRKGPAAIRLGAAAPARTTLCAALNLAVREGLLESNPARHIEVTGYRNPHAQVWTEARVGQWRRTGQRPAASTTPRRSPTRSNATRLRHALSAAGRPRP
jgi:hypothetical protein